MQCIIECENIFDNFEYEMMVMKYTQYQKQLNQKTNKKMSIEVTKILFIENQQKSNKSASTNADQRTNQFGFYMIT